LPEPMLQINFTPFPIIETARLTLRRLDEGDADEIFFHRSNEQMMRYLDKQPFKTVDEAKAWIAMVLKNDEQNEGINWGIALKGESRIIGTICLFHFAQEHERGELGYMLHFDYQGKGLMREAVTAVLDYGFRMLKLHSIEANVNPENIASIKTLEHHNFVREAYFRENYVFNGRYLDTAVYSLLSPI